MRRYQIIDPEINAKCDIIWATNPSSAIDAHVRKMGWNDYADFMEGASRHSGVRGFVAEEAPQILTPRVLERRAA